MHAADGHGTQKASSRVRDIVTRSFADNTSTVEVSRAGCKGRLICSQQKDQTFRVVLGICH